MTFLDKVIYQQMQYACYYNVPALEKLLERNDLDLDYKCTDSNITILHMLAYGNLCKPMQLLLEKGANHSLPNKYGESPLHWASRAGKFSAAATLLEYGANPDLSDLSGSTALHVAADSGFTSLVALLLSYGASTSITDNDGQTALQLAIQGSNDMHATVIGLLDGRLRYQDILSPSSFSTTPSIQYVGMSGSSVETQYPEIQEESDHDGVTHHISSTNTSTDIPEGKLPAVTTASLKPNSTYQQDSPRATITDCDVEYTDITSSRPSQSSMRSTKNTTNRSTSQHPLSDVSSPMSLRENNRSSGVSSARPASARVQAARRASLPHPFPLRPVSALPPLTAAVAASSFSNLSQSQSQSTHSLTPSPQYLPARSVILIDGVQYDPLQSVVLPVLPSST